MLTIVAMAAASVAACLITLSRVIGWKRVIKHATLIDVTFTLGTFIIFAGTITGALVAVLGGLFMAILLTGAKLGLGAYCTAHGKLRERWGEQAKSQSNDPEYDLNGVWVYNKAPYVKETR